MTGKSNRVLLHLGVHKTATSSIQRTLGARGNRAVLARAGIVAPGALASNCSGFFMSAFSEHPERYHANVRQGLGPDEIAEQVRLQKQRVATELRGLERSTVIFSGEDGCMLSPAGLDKLRDFVHQAVPAVEEISVLVYTRDPVSYVSSAIQENVKGNARTIAQARAIHVNASRNRYKGLHQRLVQAFGGERVFFRSFEQAGEVHGDVVRDFLQWIGVDPDSVQIERINESASSEAIRLLSHLCEQGLEVSAADRDAILSLPGSRDPLIDREQQEIVLRASADDREFLARTFGIDYCRARPSGVADSRSATAPEQLVRRLREVEENLDESVRAAARAFFGVDAP